MIKRRFANGVAFIALTVVAAVLGGAARTAPVQRQQVVFDYPAQFSVAGLAETADLVVVGTVGDTVAKELDFGGDGPRNPDDPTEGVPIAFVEVSVDRVLQGKAGDLLTVATLDTGLIVAERDAGLREGAKVLLFLRAETPTSAPGITVVDSHYSIVNVTQGIFDVQDERVIPRNPEIASLNVLASDSKLEPGDPVLEIEGSPREFSLDEIIGELDD